MARLDENRFRWTAAEPNGRWIRQNAAGLDVRIEDVSAATIRAVMHSLVVCVLLDAVFIVIYILM